MRRRGLQDSRMGVRREAGETLDEDSPRRESTWPWDSREQRPGAVKPEAEG